MGRFVSAITALLVLCIPFCNSVLGATLTLDLRLSPSEVQFFEPAKGSVSLVVDGYSTMNYIDYPPLPYKVFGVMLPQGDEVSAFRVEVIEHIELDASVPLAPFTGEYRDDGIRVGVNVKERESVVKDSIFPRWRVRHLDTNFYRGYRIATFAVYPFNYNMSTGRLALDTNVKLVVETEPSAPFTESLERQRYIEGFREETRKTVESMVINPGMAESYSFDEIEVDTGDRGFMPSYLPSMEGSEVAYVIVTNEEMAPAYEVLADWKTRKGVPTVVRTVEWIQQNYWSGADIAESVRHFIQEAFAKWGVEWVLLGGDTDIIPARYGYVTFYEGEFIPTDMYYSCLDGTWNADGDSIWGEAYHDAMEPGDETDLYAEVYLGRMTSSTFAEAEILVGKTISYETPVDTLSKRKFCMLAEVIFPDDYEPGDGIILDGAEICEGVYTSYLEGNPDVTTARLYQTCALYPGTICLTVMNTLSALEEGQNHVVHAGHGYKYTMSVGNGVILNYDAALLTNGDALFSMYLMNCTNVAFDVDCLAEAFLLNPNGGAFAITGCSRSAFPSSSRPYLDYYYYLLYALDVVHLAEVHVRSRLPYTPSAQGETADRWTHYIYNYLGDPETCMFQGEADTFTVSKPDSAVFGPNDITIDVSSGGSPYDSAWVCLYKDGDDYAYDKTDGSGSVTFEGFLCKSEGPIHVTVTGLNHCRYMDTIRVADEADAYLRIVQNSIEDNISGNNDGVLDAGETVVLRPKLKNTGNSAGEKLYAILKSLDANVSITDSTALYPDIPIGAQTYGLDGFVFNVDHDVGDEQAIDFTLEIHDSTGGFWYEDFALEVHAPELDLYVITRDDSPPYGNGNGTFEPGEDFLLTVGVKNFGTGAAYGLEGKIRSTDIDITISDSTAAYDDIGLLEIAYGDGFVLSEGNTTQNNYIEFELTDEYGRVFTDEIEFRGPGAPHSVVLDASVGPTEIHVTWQPPDDSDNYRYFVYHSLDQGGPYELTSVDPVLYTLYVDYDLLSSTRYYFVVSAIDSCGNMGPASAEATSTTSPPQLNGWPNKLAKETSSSVKIGDIDGDSHPEVVVGSECIYAWHGDAIEVRDGDNRPLTWGPFNEDGSTFTATVALGNLDGLPGNEIIGSSWDTKQIWAWTSDGDTLDGWPQTTKYLCWASPVIGDFDDDGDNEVIAYDIQGRVYVWHDDGTELLDGDGDPATNGVFYLTGSYIWHLSTPALADMDEDGELELIVCAPDDSIYCLNSDASAVPGWPIPVADVGADIKASPAVGDIDNDGHPEVVVASTSARIYGLNHDGTTMTGWPKWVYSNYPYFAGSPVIADLTGDGYLEVIVPSMNSYVYIFRYDGVPLQTYNPIYDWPQMYASSGATESSPMVADIDEDGSPDIIIGSEEGLISAWNVFGDYIAGFPILLKGFARGTPIAGDLDLDGDLELATSCWDANIYVWDLEATCYYGAIQWNGFHGNIHNTGNSDFDASTAVEEISFAYDFKPGAIELTWIVGSTVDSWNLFRGKEGMEFEFLTGYLRPDEQGMIRYVDRNAEEGVTYRYRLVAEGRSDITFETGDLEMPITTVRLYQNHPNPFNPATTITFTIPGGAETRENVVLVIFDVRGARVKTLVDEKLPGGRHTVQWDGKNNRGEQVATGVYFFRLRAGGYEDARKMILLR